MLEIALIAVGGLVIFGTFVYVVNRLSPPAKRRDQGPMASRETFEAIPDKSPGVIHHMGQPDLGTKGVMWSETVD